MTQAPSAELYLVWSHEHGLWWGPGKMGYVRDLAQAGRYTREAAIAVCQDALPGTFQRYGQLPELPVRLADLLALLDGIEPTESEEE